MVLLAAFALLAQVPVLMETDAGNIAVELDERAAPLTVANFLRYVDAGQYDGGRFHRTVVSAPDNQPQSQIKIDVIQGGPAANAEAFPPVALERTDKTGLRHLDGTISMARSSPDSATGDFLVCVGAQPSLDAGGMRNPDGQGFAPFGRVTDGMDIVRKIHRSPAGPTNSASTAAAGNQRLNPPVRIIRVKRVN